MLLIAGGCASQSDKPPEPGVQSGLQRGDDIIPWNPIHVAGPDAGTNACPVCTYETRPAVLIFVRNLQDVPPLATRLQDMVNQQQKRDLKGFIIVLDASPQQLKQMAADLKITRIGLCYPDPQTRDHDLSEYRIAPAAMDTVMVYKNFKVCANFVNVDAGNFDQVSAAVAQLR